MRISFIPIFIEQLSVPGSGAGVMYSGNSYSHVERGNKTYKQIFICISSSPTLLS